jgi:hypothetical protein
MRRLIVTLMAFGLVLGACSSDPTSSEEYQQLEQQLTDMTAERDALADQIAASDSRYETVIASQEAVAEIIADPAAYGSREEVLDLLMSYATPDAVMEDVAFGSIGMRQGWNNTVFGSEADIQTFAKWTAEDGSMAGSLWVWSGTANNGEPFELIGINTDYYDENGLITHELVEWPYENAYVTNALVSGS